MQKASMYRKCGWQALPIQVPAPSFRRSISLHQPSASDERSLPRLLQASTIVEASDLQSLLVRRRLGSFAEGAEGGDALDGASAGGVSFAPHPAANAATIVIAQLRITKLRIA